MDGPDSEGDWEEDEVWYLIYEYVYYRQYSRRRGEQLGGENEVIHTWLYINGKI